MPPKERIGLDNAEHLFPVSGSPRQDEQEHPIGPGESWALHLTAKNLD